MAAVEPVVVEDAEDEEEGFEQDVAKVAIDKPEQDGLMTPLLITGDTTTTTLTKSQQLVTSKNVRKLTLWALQLGVLADAVTTVILRPSYPFLVLPRSEQNPHAFPSTAPFDFAADLAGISASQTPSFQYSTFPVSVTSPIWL